MISDRLVHLIEQHAEELSRRWLNLIRQDTYVLTYHRFSEDKLKNLAFHLYRHLSEYLQAGANRHKVEEVYTQLGAERFHEGFEASEVVRALVLSKRNLWTFIMNRGFMDGATELYQMLELYTTISLFFDRAIFFTVRGYEREADILQRAAEAAESSR